MTSFIYFDVGGTVIKDFTCRPDLWSNLKKNCGITDKYWEEYCSGKLDLGIVPDNLPVPYDDFLEGFVSKFEQNSSIWPVLRQIAEKVPVGLLTNMYFGMFNSIKKHGLLPSVNWKIIIDTSVVKLQKPKEEIYLLAQQKTGVKPEEIVFVDNVEENLNVPRKLGWQTFWYNSADYEASSKQLKTYFSQIGLF